MSTKPGAPGHLHSTDTLICQRCLQCRFADEARIPRIALSWSAHRCAFSSLSRANSCYSWEVSNCKHCCKYQIASRIQKQLVQTRTKFYKFNKVTEWFWPIESGRMRGGTLARSAFSTCMRASFCSRARFASRSISAARIAFISPSSVHPPARLQHSELHEHFDSMTHDKTRSCGFVLCASWTPT